MNNLLLFRTIDMKRDREKVIKYRKDSFRVSFGNLSGFGDEIEYLQWLEEKISLYPDGFVIAEMDNNPIGQLELSIREWNGKKIGYVHLYYLAPKYRGKGIGKELHRYARTFFESNRLMEYHLRVSPTNKRALRFYREIGLEEIGAELDGKVIRMKGII
ncbi:GNAT family N-acetyltransferase [Radiobacillus kanasensis]|uniref:GNAT family N-acetyltransferase n=1 Tax=Radiobacillus kanasensis TaxID=2844358 RepID=UPI001E2BD2FC|nr:GNAT family N-acetyltransferase [Radiobacillus kanasensis]UFU01413.1 GNAT family N-acetyltransferase [Radiobacillus kanasensis]